MNSKSYSLPRLLVNLPEKLSHLVECLPTNLPVLLPLGVYSLMTYLLRAMSRSSHYTRTSLNFVLGLSL